MIEEKAIKICGKEVKMRYCLAAEQGFEILGDGKTSDIFRPTVLEYDEQGKPSKIDMPKATTTDYVKLACAAIVAAYERNNEKVPITVEEIIYEATTDEIEALVSSVIELRLKWYNIPSIIKSETKTTEEDNGKNA